MAWKYKDKRLKKKELSPNSIAGKEDAPPPHPKNKDKSKGR
jgi:hypothetical protein